MSKSGQAIVIRGNALKPPLPDASVDLIITSPPYFALRSYRDSGDHYAGQIGSEPTPQEWLEALWACMAEWWRVLKPTGSVFVNLGDKRSGSGGHNNSQLSKKATLGQNWRPLEREVQDVIATRRNAPDRYNQAAFGRAKSKMLLPHRFAIGCEDGLADPQGIGWIMRQDLCWHKKNGLPESTKDRHRDSHEFIFHFTKQERYFAALDEIREAHNPNTHARGKDGSMVRDGVPIPTWGINGTQSLRGVQRKYTGPDPLGKLPGSVWPMASEPLIIPQWAREKFDLKDHFAAFPSELPRKLILGFSPSGICVECDQGRRPVVDKRLVDLPGGSRMDKVNDQRRGAEPLVASLAARAGTEATIVGYACACTPYTDHKGTGGSSRQDELVEGRLAGQFANGESNRPALGSFQRVNQREYHLDRWTPPPTRPAVILDPFGGTGTVAMVAKALGRTGISVDLSADYSRLAQWRIFESGHGKKAEQRTWGERQGSML